VLSSFARTSPRNDAACCSKIAFTCEQWQELPSVEVVIVARVGSCRCSRRGDIYTSLNCKILGILCIPVNLERQQCHVWKHARYKRLRERHTDTLLEVHALRHLRQRAHVSLRDTLILRARIKCRSRFRSELSSLHVRANKRAELRPCEFPAIRQSAPGRIARCLALGCSKRRWLVSSGVHVGR